MRRLVPWPSYSYSYSYSGDASRRVQGRFGFIWIGLIMVSQDWYVSFLKWKHHWYVPSITQWVNDVADVDGEWIHSCVHDPKKPVTYHWHWIWIWCLKSLMFYYVIWLYAITIKNSRQINGVTKYEIRKIRQSRIIEIGLRYVKINYTYNG